MAIELLILGVAVWRSSAMLVNEGGPFDVFRRLRKRLGAGEFGGPTLDATRLHPGELEEAMRRTPSRVPLLPGLFSCVWCMSWWIGAAGTVAYVVAPQAAIICALPFALSAIAVFLELFSNRLSEE